MKIVSKPGADGPALGEREIEIMRALWVAGSGTVAEVRRKLAAELAYTTVLTILRNLESKGYVAHKEEGRVHRYAPLLGRSEATNAAIRRVIDSFFEGSADQLVRYLAQQRMIGRKDLKRIRREMSKGLIEPEKNSEKREKKKLAKKDRPAQTAEIRLMESDAVKGNGGGVELAPSLSDGQLMSPVVLDGQNPGETQPAPAVNDSVEHL